MIGLQPSDFDELLPMLTSLNGARDAMLRLVTELCNINSGTMNIEGVRSVTEILVREYRSLGGTLSLVDVNPLTRVDERGEVVQTDLGPALHITNRTEARPRVLLCIHMDTVYPIDHDFQTCKTLPDGRLNGPGVADAKGGLVVMLYALRMLENSPLADRMGWEVIINSDEEIGSPGSEELLHSRAAKADVGLLFEPSLPDGSLVSWRRGTGNFTFVFRGKSAHSGRDFERGRNAVVACCSMMSQIHALNTNPEVTYNVGKISGGDALNIVPDLAIGRVNVRVKTIGQQAEVERTLDQMVATFGALDGIHVAKYGRFSSPPKQVTPDTIQLQKRFEVCGSVLGTEVKWQGSGGASDGNKFAAAGLPNIDSLGPRGGNIHSREEFLIPESLVERAKLTALVLLSIAKFG